MKAMVWSLRRNSYSAPCRRNPDVAAIDAGSALYGLQLPCDRFRLCHHLLLSIDTDREVRSAAIVRSAPQLILGCRPRGVRAPPGHFSCQRSADPRAVKDNGNRTRWHLGLFRAMQSSKCGDV